MSDVGKNSSAVTGDIDRSGKILEINALSLGQPLVVVGVIGKKDATLIESYLLKNFKFLKVC